MQGPSGFIWACLDLQEACLLHRREALPSSSLPTCPKIISASLWLLDDPEGPLEAQAWKLKPREDKAFIFSSHLFHCL